MRSRWARRIAATPHAGLRTMIPTFQVFLHLPCRREQPARAAAALARALPTGWTYRGPITRARRLVMRRSAVLSLAAAGALLVSGLAIHSPPSFAQEDDTEMGVGTDAGVGT